MELSSKPRAPKTSLVDKAKDCIYRLESLRQDAAAAKMHRGSHSKTIPILDYVKGQAEDNINRLLVWIKEAEYLNRNTQDSMSEVLDALSVHIQSARSALESRIRQRRNRIHLKRPEQRASAEAHLQDTIALVKTTIGTLLAATGNIIISTEESNAPRVGIQSKRRGPGEDIPAAVRAGDDTWEGPTPTTSSSRAGVFGPMQSKTEDSFLMRQARPNDYKPSRSKALQELRALSPDKKLVALGYSDMAVMIWNSVTGRVLHTLKGHSGSVYSVVFSQDGNLLASGTDDGEIKIWDITTGESLPHLESHSDVIKSVLFPSEQSESWALYEKSVLDGEKHALRLLIGWRAEFVKEQHPWVFELLEDGELSPDEIVDLLWESENLQWVQSEPRPSQQDQEEEKWDLESPLEHLENCAHQLSLQTVSSKENLLDSGDKTVPEESEVTKGGASDDRPLSASHTNSPVSKSECSLDGDERFVKLEAQERNLMKRCGIGGVFPPDYSKSNPGFAILHSNIADIIYGGSKPQAGPFVPTKSPLAPESLVSKQPQLQGQLSGQDERELWDHGAQSVREALANVLNALAYLNADHGCCNSFTVLFHSSKRTSVLQVVSISRQLLYDLHSAIQAVASEAEGWENMLTTVCLKAMRAWRLDDLFTAYLHNDKQTPFNVFRYLNFSALVAQVASLGLVTYSRGHSRDFYHDSLSRTIETFVLLGLDSSGPCIYAERFGLACMGKMLGRRVWAFHTDETAIGKKQESLLLSTTVRNLLETWGGSTLSDDAGPDHKIFLRIGAGFVFAMADQSEAPQIVLEEEVYCHWTSDRNMNLKKPGRFAMDSQLLIGATCLNLDCNLTVASCQAAISGALFAMGTRPPRWRTSERSLTAAGGFHGFVTGGTVTQIKDDGKFRKTLLMENWEKHMNLRILNSPWGLELSLCTGIARRVPLKNLFHGEVLKYLRANLPGEWSKIENKAATIPEISRADLDLLVEGMTEGERKILRKATELLLHAMEYTGVEEDGQTLTLWWPEDDVDTPRGVKFDKRQYSGQNPWISMIKDSESCAVFGIATKSCLEHLDLRKCQNRNPTATWRAVDNIILVTSLTPVGMSPFSPLSYSLGERYVLWQREEILRVIKSRDPGQDVVHLRFDPGRWPIIVRKRLFSRWTKVREREALRDLGQDVLVL